MHNTRLSRDQFARLVPGPKRSIYEHAKSNLLFPSHHQPHHTSCHLLSNSKHLPPPLLSGYSLTHYPNTIGSGHHRDEVLVPWIWWYDRASEAQRMCTCWLAPIIMYFGEYRASEVRIVPMLTATSWWCVTCIHGYWFFTMYIIYLSNPWPPPNLYITTW